MPALPVQPGLASIPQSLGDEAAGVSPDSSAEDGALPKLFFSLEQSLDTVARAIPREADAIDAIKESLRDVLARALQGESVNQGGEIEPLRGQHPEGPPLS